MRVSVDTMPDADTEKRIAKLQRRLQHARFATRDAERHLAAIERQTGFESNPKRARKQINVGLAKLEKCQQAEAELERELAELRGEGEPAAEEQPGTAPAETDTTGEEDGQTDDNSGCSE